MPSNRTSNHIDLVQPTQYNVQPNRCAKKPPPKPWPLPDFTPMTIRFGWSNWLVLIDNGRTNSGYYRLIAPFSDPFLIYSPNSMWLPTECHYQPLNMIHAFHIFLYNRFQGLFANYVQGSHQLWTFITCQPTIVLLPFLDQIKAILILYNAAFVFNTSVHLSLHICV